MLFMLLKSSPPPKFVRIRQKGRGRLFKTQRKNISLPTSCEPYVPAQIAGQEIQKLIIQRIMHFYSLFISRYLILSWTELLSLFSFKRVIVKLSSSYEKRKNKSNKKEEVPKAPRVFIFNWDILQLLTQVSSYFL